MTFAKLALLIVLINTAAVLRIRHYATHSRTLGLLRSVVAIVRMIFRVAMKRRHGNQNRR